MSAFHSRKAFPNSVIFTHPIVFLAMANHILVNGATEVLPLNPLSFLNSSDLLSMCWKISSACSKLILSSDVS